MTHKEVMAKLFDFNATTYYAWKKQNRPIINLIDKYFTKEDLQEFIEKGSITSLDSFHQNKNIQDIDILNNVSSLVKKQLKEKLVV